MKEFGQLIPELPVSVPIVKEMELERIEPLSKKEFVDIAAGKVCGCPSCRKTAEPALLKNPLLKNLDFREAQGMWQVITKDRRRS